MCPCGWTHTDGWFQLHAFYIVAEVQPMRKKNLYDMPVILNLSYILRDHTLSIPPSSYPCNLLI